MNRRHFSLTLAAAASLAALGAWPSATWAQGAKYTEGKEYTRLPQPVPLTDLGRKVDVVEFFWYGCPHCNAFEPTLEPWVANLPKDQVRFRRIHVAFNALQEIHQRLFCTLESMGLVDKLHAKVFAAFHVHHKPINSVEDAVQFATANGVDPQKFRAAWDSFAVSTKVKQYAAAQDAYRIDSVPTLAVQGHYLTSPADAGGPQQALDVTNHLIDLARKGA